MQYNTYILIYPGFFGISLSIMRTPSFIFPLLVSSISLPLLLVFLNSKDTKQYSPTPHRENTSFGPSTRNFKSAQKVTREFIELRKLPENQSNPTYPAYQFLKLSARIKCISFA